MMEEVAEALQDRDYRTAQILLKELKQSEPQNPWVNFYMARLYESTGKLATAEKVYRQLLKGTTNTKIITQARQGLARIEAIEVEQKRTAIANALAEPGGKEPGILILEQIAPEMRKTAGEKFARIMELDPYVARLQLPGRGWRLFRTGPVGELGYYTSRLQQAEINSFCIPINDLAKINVFNINYFESVAPQPIVYCKSKEGQMGKLTFDWSEVQQRVEGLLPLFEKIEVMDARRKFQEKTKTLDYSQFCDLHLPQRNAILRFSDSYYEFQKGITLAQKPKDIQPKNLTTTRKNWQNLTDFFNHKLPETPIWSDFSVFADIALDFQELLKRIEANIELVRPEPTLWDQAFQLYSSLVFLRNNPENNKI
ncbi:MAG: tetratricopeptide repeat protein [Oscillatoria sp. PMC 1051.18]|nr:tetratricopeptide repeat protein [Oscillatoria sp. PMC 1050.18]MEC5030745.1 tetratricopeptide repeat protein [Oscillatoria sp. PMC 1051.18]